MKMDNYEKYFTSAYWDDYMKRFEPCKFAKKLVKLTGKYNDHDMEMIIEAATKAADDNKVENYNEHLLYI